MNEEDGIDAIVSGPAGPWGRTWILTLGIVALVLAAHEARLRAAGYQASVPDTAELLARARARSYEPGAYTILGSSRIQCAIDLQIMAEASAGAVPAQLAILGSSPLPVLEDLANDERFGGQVLCEVTPSIFFDGERTDLRVRARLREADVARRSPGRIIELELSLFLSSMLLLANTDHELTRPPAEGEPRASMVMTPDRMVCISGDRDAVVSPAQRQPVHAVESPDPSVIFERTRIAIDRITARGGSVVFVTLPQIDSDAQSDAQRFPRSRYFDALLQATGCPGIFHADHATLSAFKCVDTQHLDARDATAFTRALCEIMPMR